MVLSLSVFGGNFLRKSNVPELGHWPLAGVWRLPLPLFGGSKCVKSMLKSIRTLRFGHCREVGRCWEGLLTEVPLYYTPYVCLSSFYCQQAIILLSSFVSFLSSSFRGIPSIEKKQPLPFASLAIIFTTPTQRHKHTTYKDLDDSSYRHSASTCLYKYYLATVK